MVPAIADVDCNPAICCVEHRMPSVAFQVVRGLIEVPDPGYMILQTAIAIKATWLTARIASAYSSQPYMLASVCLCLCTMVPCQITVDPSQSEDINRNGSSHNRQKYVKVEDDEYISMDGCVGHLPVFAKNVAFVSNEHSCVPYGLSMGFIPFQYWVDDDHFVLLSILLQHLGGWACFCRLSKF